MAKRQTIMCTLLTWLLLWGWMLKKWFMVGTREGTSEWRRLLFEKAWETAERAGLVVTRSLPYCPVQFLWLSWLIWLHQNTVLTAEVPPPHLRFSEFLTQYQPLVKQDLISSSTSSSWEHKWKIPVEDGESSCKCVTWANTHGVRLHACRGSRTWEWEKNPPSKGNLPNAKCVLERRQKRNYKEQKQGVVGLCWSWCNTWLIHVISHA